MDVEILKLISKSISTSSPNSLTLRIDDLAISELTKAFSEYALANVSVTFLIRSDGGYASLGSFTSSIEEGGLDVTKKHAANIIRGLQGTIDQFSEKDLDLLMSQVSQYTSLDNMNVEYIKPSSLKLFNEAYARGVFENFEEFKNNDPSITAVEIAHKSDIKVWSISDGKRTRIKNNAFAASDGIKLYILFNKKFYELNITQDNVTFIGPHVPDQAAVTTGAVLGGAIGGAIAGASSGGSSVYEINLGNGAIKEIGPAK